MSKRSMRMCQGCADRVDAEKNAAGPYYLTPVEGSEERRECGLCHETYVTKVYKIESKAERAMKRAMQQQRANACSARRDTRAYYREPFRSEGVE